MVVCVVCVVYTLHTPLHTRCLHTSQSNISVNGVMSLFRGYKHVVYILHESITEYCSVNGVENIFHDDEMIFMFPEKSK